MSQAPSDDLRGTVIAGKYELVRLLGQGGMGAVYEGRNTSTLKRVAVKLLYEEFGREEAVVKRFFREAQASSIIESDYIVQVYDSGTDPVTRFPYMVMEMLQGGDLEELVKRTGALNPLVVAKIMLQVTMGLGKAHEAGIIHRDIKPANLYLTTREDGDCVVKILDFGIAKMRVERFGEQASSGLTATGSVLGTPLYMSPEQARGLSGIDARSDVWSLGVVMFELLSGQVPYTNAATLGDLIVAIVTADLPLLQDVAPWVPPELAEITHRAMSRDLDKRYPNAVAMREALLPLVPDGPRFQKAHVTPVPAEQRAHVAPRLQLTHGMLKAVNRTGLALTQNKPPEKPSSRGTALAVVGGVVGLAVLGTGGYLAIDAMRKPTATAPLPPPAAVPAAPSEPTAKPEATTTGTAAARSYQLVVLPAGVSVAVDGQPVPVKNDVVFLSGTPGTTRLVKLSRGKDETEVMVALTETGVIPAKLELSSTARATGAPAGRPAPASKPGDKPTAADKPSTGPGKPLQTDTGEFQ